MAFIIAEIGTAHEGDEKKAEALIDCAVSSGCDAVKFQWVYAAEILHPDTGYVNLPAGNIRLYDRFKQLECPPSFYERMRDYAHKNGVKFVCSPFGLKSLDELLAIQPDYVKIASPELNHYPLLSRLSSYRTFCRETGKTPVPVIVSSGVSRLSDIENALKILGTDGVSLLHCITSYPAPETEYNVRLIANLARIFGVKTGISDHSLDPVLVPVLSVVCGASIVEKHITLSRKTSGLDDPVALEGEQFALMVHCIRQCETALAHYGTEEGGRRVISQLEQSYERARIDAVLGNGIKRLAPSEKENYSRTNRSLHFMRSMKKGEIICNEDVGVLRTEKTLSPGISPEFLPLVTGAELSRDVKDGEGVQLSDFMNRV